MSFLDELKKRHVVKVGAAYGIVAWLLVQAADVFVPALHLPAWVITLVAGLVLAGFPIALLLAWAYEVTPDGIVPNADAQGSHSAPAAGQRLNLAIMGMVVLAVTFLIFDRFFLDPGATGAPGARTPTNGELPVIAASIRLPATAPLGIGAADIGFDSPSIAVSRDSRWLVYVSMIDGESLLFRQRLDGFAEPQPIPGTGGAIHAFFSPDDKYIGFLTNERIKRVTVQGEDVKTIAQANSPVRAQWMTQDLIYAVEDQGNTLRKVEVRTGKADAVQDYGPPVFSHVLPGAHFALATLRASSTSGDYNEIHRVDLESGAISPLGISGFDARWVPSGHMVYGRNGNLYAVAIDLDSAEVTGEPVLVLTGVAMDSTFDQAHYTVSASGTLAFVPGTDRAIGQIVAVGPDGEEQVLPPEERRFGALDLSANDGEMALQVADIKDFVWVYNLKTGKGRKLVGSVGYGWPKFSRSGALALSENTAKTVDSTIKVFPAGGGESYLVMDSDEYEIVVSDWSPDEKTLAMTEWNVNQMMLYPVSGQEPPTLFDNTVMEWGAVFSPDARWLAYSSIETGRFEVWVRSLPDGELRRQVSVNGGIESVWCPCGKIFFRRGDEFWFVTVQTEPELSFGPEQLAFTVTDFLDTRGRSYDVSSDGQTLYTLKRSEAAISDRVHLKSNWLGALARIAPTEAQ